MADAPRWARLLEADRLAAAVAGLRGRKLYPGGDAIGPDRFFAAAADELRELHRDLADGAYAPLPCRLARVAVEDGFHSRRLRPLRDLVVEEALLALFSDSCFSAGPHPVFPDPDHGQTADALAALDGWLPAGVTRARAWRLARRREAGLAELEADAARLLVDPQLRTLLAALAAPGLDDGRQLVAPPGTLLEGLPATRWLRALAWSPADGAAARLPFYLRWGELAVIGHRDRRGLTRAGERYRRALAGTAIAAARRAGGGNFRGGFVLNGARCARDGVTLAGCSPAELRQMESEEVEEKRQAALAAANVLAPPRADLLTGTLFVSGRGAVIAREQEMVAVRGGGRTAVAVPREAVERLVLFGNVTLDAELMEDALARGVTVSWLTESGGYCGALTETHHDDTETLVAQLDRYEDVRWCVLMARRFLDAKLANTLALVRRFAPRLPPDDYREFCRRTDLARAELLQVEDNFDRLRGIEGSHAAAYFAILPRFLRDTFGFIRRVRRPPTDPVNAMLSFGYTILFYNLFSLVKAHHLSPYIGCLHALRERHAGLVSDMLEPFRAPLVDTLVVRLINTRRFKREDFVTETVAPYRCLMADAARRRFYTAMMDRLATEVYCSELGRRVPYRYLLDHYVVAYRAFVRGERESFVPHYHRLF